jgi:hypothetical protein
MTRNVRPTHNEHLRNKKVAAEYLKEALADSDKSISKMALRNIAEANSSTVRKNNPDLPTDFVSSAIKAQREKDSGLMTPYTFGYERQNLSMTTKIELDENGDWVFNIPDELLSDGRFREGDEFEIKEHKDKIELINISCKTMPESVVKRNFNSLMKRINNDKCYLNRVLITIKGNPSYSLESEDIELRKLVEERRNQLEIDVSIDDL